MDADRFDQLARMLSSFATRRGVLRLLSITLPTGSLALLIDEDESQARRRRHQGRKRRKRRNRHKKCKPESILQTCDGQCGAVPNNCQKTVDCGPCACTPTSCGSGEICCEGECRACAAPPNSTSSCATGGCSWFCNEGFHRCSDSCVANDSPQTCGVRCTPCPPGEDCDGTDCTCGGGPSCGAVGCCDEQCCPAD